MGFQVYYEQQLFIDFQSVAAILASVLIKVFWIPRNQFNIFFSMLTLYCENVLWVVYSYWIFIWIGSMDVFFLIEKCFCGQWTFRIPNGWIPTLFSIIKCNRYGMRHTRHVFIRLRDPRYRNLLIWF